MKELTIIEKAKAYDEAIEVAQRFYNNSVAITKKGLEDIFPELKESEDKRIMEKVIATIHLYYGEPLEDEAKEMVAWLEKKGEQKPTWSEEDVAMLDSAIAFVEHSAFTTIGKGKGGVVAWLKSLKYKYTWKPSYVQMEVLLSEVTACTKGCPKQIVLESIYNDLKKLREE